MVTRISTERKAALAYDEHASINRNMQLISTGLTELKHAGLHIILIGHLAKKYQTSGSALRDVGLRVLADEAISYEADAVLIVERSGMERTVTPIIKPPRPAHLHLDRRSPASMATRDPDQKISAMLAGLDGREGCIETEEASSPAPARTAWRSAPAGGSG
jgi:hypothetical protein